jgi:hypothetical protein
MADRDDAQRLNELIGKLDGLTAVIEERVKQESSGGHTQTVIHKSEGMGAWGAAAVVACFFTVLMMIFGAVIFVPDIHDLRAWKDIHHNDIAALKADVKQIKEKK